MKTFLEITDKSYYFTNCETCEARCCDGREGSVFSQILLEDFEEVYKNFPIVFIFGDMGYLKPVILLADNTGFCPYIKENKCTIYQDRPSVCRTYPLSPNIDDKVYIDDSCPAIFSEKVNNAVPIVEDGIVNKNFTHKNLSSYQDKYIDTHLELEKLNNKNDFELIKTTNGIKFYKYTGNIENSYILYHKESLKNNPII